MQGAHCVCHTASSHWLQKGQQEEKIQGGGGGVSRRDGGAYRGAHTCADRIQASEVNKRVQTVQHTARRIADTTAPSDGHNATGSSSSSHCEQQRRERLTRWWALQSELLLPQAHMVTSTLVWAIKPTQHVGQRTACQTALTQLKPRIPAAAAAAAYNATSQGDECTQT